MANFGETLKQARAHKGVTLKEAEQATRINRSHLAALEDENFRAMPPLIYQRGIVRNYALYLDLDPSRLLMSFEEARGDDGDSQPRGVQAVPPLNMPTHWAPNFAIISFSVVLSAIVFAWVYSAFVQPTDDQAEATEIIATVTPLANDVALPTEAPATATPESSPTPEPTATPVVAERVDTGRDLPATEPPLASGPAAPPVTGASEASEQDPIVASVSGDGSDNQLQNQQERPGEESAPAIEALLEQSTNADQSPASNTTAEGAYITSIRVEAEDDITISIVADGLEVFNGPLAEGEETEFYDASVFEVYTSSGANTFFTNACGLGFYAGYEPGEVVYSLPADESSCAPVGN
jgi:cytoskeletal protein RodZ